VNELRVAKIDTLAAANVYLRDRFVPDYNATFSCPAADPANVFVPLGRVDLEQILCHQEERVVGRDNTVLFDGRAFQLPPQPGRRSCAGLHVTVRRHLNGEYSIWYGPRQLGCYRATTAAKHDARTAVRPVEAAGAVDAKGASTAPWKTPKARFPQLPQASASKRTDHLSNGSGQITCQQHVIGSRTDRAARKS
jgi:hypothetical protein